MCKALVTPVGFEPPRGHIPRNWSRTYSLSATLSLTCLRLKFVWFRLTGFESHPSQTLTRALSLTACSLSTTSTCDSLTNTHSVTKTLLSLRWQHPFPFLQVTKTLLSLRGQRPFPNFSRSSEWNWTYAEGSNCRQMNAAMSVRLDALCEAKPDSRGYTTEEWPKCFKGKGIEPICPTCICPTYIYAYMYMCYSYVLHIYVCFSYEEE